MIILVVLVVVIILFVKYSLLIFFKVVCVMIMFCGFLLRISSVCKLVLIVVDMCVKIVFLGDKFLFRIFVMSFEFMCVIGGLIVLFLFFLLVIFVRIDLI